VVKKNKGKSERTNNSANLVQCFVNSKPPAPAHPFCGIGKHGISGRSSYCLSCPFQNDKHSGNLPIAGKCQQGNGDKQSITDKGQNPICLSAIDKIARSQAQSIANESADAGYQTDNTGTRPQRSQIRSGNAPNLFVGYIPEQA
jgi:hypothetical protein